jgi:NAD(P)H-dependent flavin oxidoreductase YrpB (nitropropane dioxygenase family)
MNQVSTVSLAVAVHKAGALPSMVSYSHYDLSHDQAYKQNLDKAQLFDSINRYVQSTGHSSLLLALNPKDLCDDDVVNFVVDSKISHVLLYGSIGGIGLHNLEAKVIDKKDQAMVRSYLDRYQEYFDLLPCKKLKLATTANSGVWHNGGYVVKGNEGAGRPGSDPLTVAFAQQLSKNPLMPVVPMGGIGSAEQVSWYIKHGAAAVAVGTRLAATRESVLSTQVKQAMVRASAKDLSVLDPDLKQKALVFDNFTQQDVANHTRSLRSGIVSAADQGHVFAGTAIDHIQCIWSAQEVIDELTSLLMNK